MNPENVIVFRCKEGGLYETAREAATCNLSNEIKAIVIDGKKPSLPYKPVLNNPLMKAAEYTTLQHWISENTTLLESLIANFVDDCASGTVMPTKQPENKA